MQGKSGGALAVPADRTREMLRTVGRELELKSKFLSHMLPKEITPERLRAFSLLALQRIPQLLNCSVPSLLGAVYEAAQAGLAPDSVDSVIIPYGNKAQFQIMFRGMMKLARRAEGGITQIWADTIRERDDFVEERGMTPALTHTILRSEDGKPLSETARGELIAAYACARFADGFVQPHVVYRDEIERAKKTSGGSVWKTHEPAMWAKTAIKRLCKVLPMPDQVQRAIVLDDQAEAGVDQKLDASWMAAPSDDGPEVTDYGRDAIDAE